MTLSPRRSTLFPYTTLFRSRQRRRQHELSPLDAAFADRDRDQPAFARRSVAAAAARDRVRPADAGRDRKSTRLNSSHLGISYAVFFLKKKKTHCRIVVSDNC